MKRAGFLVLCLVLAGCVNKSQTGQKSLVTPLPAETAAPQATQPAAVENTVSLTANETCTKELSALQSYDQRSWNKYSSEMSELISKTSQFLTVRDDLNPKINELVMSVYDSRMKTLCYKIESTLGQAMVAQASQL